MIKFSLGGTKHFFHKIWFLWSICLLFNIITFFFIYYKIKPGGKTLALYVNVLVGVEWYGKGKNLYFLPLVGFLILIVNFILYRSAVKSKKIFPDLVIFTTLAVELILLASGLFLGTVN